MKVGQTSIVVFGSRVLGSAVGFLATILFARLLGATVLGQYALVLALVSWLSLVGDVGVSSAISKRISEGSDRGEFAGAGLLTVIGSGVVVSVLSLVFSSSIDRYVGRPVAIFVVALLMLALFETVVTSILNGQHSVHIAGLLGPARILTRSTAQIAAVLAGMGLIGLLIGHAAGWLVSAIIGTAFLRVRIKTPTHQHFEQLIMYAKYAWVGGLRSRSFNYVDILVLGLFVPSSLVGVYSVAWGITRFLTTFDSAISQTIFPEISRADAEAERERVAGLITDALRFSGLILIPGLIGGVLLGERLLRLYGPEFEQGTTVLGLLILSTILFGYKKQLLTALNAIDRPNLAFRINLFFICLNAVANVILIYQYGWIGAAIATVLSAGAGAGLTTKVLYGKVEFSFPYREILKQVVAAIGMGVVVYGGLLLETTYKVLEHNLTTVLLFVLLGTGIYTCMLLLISSNFRRTIRRNLPDTVRLPAEY